MTTSHDQLIRELPDRLSGRGPEWLRGLRRDAAERLRERGLPTKKTEAWRFTPVEPLAQASLYPTLHPSRTSTQPLGDGTREESSSAAVALAEERLGPAGQDGTWRVVLVGGKPVLDAEPGPPEGVAVESLAELVEREPAWVEGHLGKLAPREDFAGLNAALFRDGVVVRIAPGVSVPRAIHLVHAGVAADAPTAVYPRVLVVVEHRAQARLVESFVVGEGAEHLTNVVAEVRVGDDSVLDHLRVNEGAAHGLHVGTLAVAQGRNSVYRSRVVTLGGALSRLDLRVALEGEGAECLLEGVYHAAGREHVDHHTFIDHARPRCTSHEAYRGILDGHGHAVFDGTIVVRPGAQHTDARQENRNLLLSDDAAINTKPHLEIEADDVKCSHGATIGSIDEDQLFYLRARGMGLEQARTLLTFAFVQELLDHVPHGELRHRLAGAVLDRLPHGETIRELT